MRSFRSIGYIRSMSSKRILLAVSNPLYRDAISEFLTRKRGVTLVGKVGNGWEVLQLSTRLKPDIILIDFPIILLIDDDSIEFTNWVTQSGAWAYLLKSQIIEELPVLLDKLERTDQALVQPGS
jgi:DNA-binding NarL/FixJ family response regulator